MMASSKKEIEWEVFKESLKTSHLVTIFIIVSKIFIL